MRNLVFFSILILISCMMLFAQVPQLINYQGFLKDNDGQPLNGQVDLHFRIFDTETGGTALWDEPYTAVPVNNGIFHVILGSSKSIDNTVFQGSGQRFLEIEVNRNILGRFLLTSVAYSMRAQSAEISDDVSDNSITTAKLSDGAVSTIKLQNDAVIGTKIQDGSIREQDIANNQVVKSLNQIKDNVYLEQGTNVTITPMNDSTLQISASGTGGGNTLDQAYDQGGAGFGRIITADGGAVDIRGNDGLLVNGNIGIGYTATNERLDVNGNVRIANNLYSTDSLILNSDTAYKLKLNSGKPGDVILTGSGNVGIGTSSPVGKLDVDGTARVTGLQLPINAQAGYVLTSDASGNGSWQAPSGGIGGSGTLNYIPVFSAAATLDTSMLYQYGRRLGIGTTVTGSYKVTINAATTAGLGIKLHNAGGLPTMLFKYDGGNVDEKSWSIAAGGNYFNIRTIRDNDATIISTPFAISRDGYVGIGETYPGYPLDIVTSNTVNGIVVNHDGQDSGTGFTRGIYVDAVNSGSTGNVYAVSAQATQDAASGAAVGVYGYATGTTSGPKYGILGNATGTGDVYAGYFYGRVEATETITADSVLYSSPRTHYYAVPGEAFQPYMNVNYTNSGAVGGAYIHAGYGGALVAAVHLPDGATITRFTAYFYDTDSETLTASLSRNYFSLGYTATMASVTSSGDGGYENASDTTIGNAVVDNMSGGLRISVGSTSWSSAQQIIGVLIEYTVDQAE